MKNVSRLFSDLLQDESGQDLIEYALVAALIGSGATASMKALATTIGTALTSIGTRLNALSNVDRVKLGLAPIDPRLLS